MGKKHVVIFIVLITGIFSLALSQEIDAFYMRVFNKGVTLFKAGNFREAVKEFEVAVFGIEENDELLGKAHLYMGLSYFYIDQKQESEKHLREAIHYIGSQGIYEVELSSQRKDDLIQILAFLEITGSPSETLFASPKKSDPDSKALRKNKINDLETVIKNNPDEIEAYYNLTTLYVENNEIKKATNTLEKLTKQHPLESKAFLLLGVLHFKEKKFKKAEYYFSRIFAVSDSVEVSPEIMNTSRAYQILSFYYRGKKNKTYELAKKYSHFLTSNTINDLELGNRNRRVLLEIMSKQ